MCAYFNGPRIVVDNLIGYWDAGNTKSLPTTGSATWIDLMRTQNGSINQAGTFYQPLFGGALSGNGTSNSQVTITNAAFSMNTGNYSLGAWIRPTENKAMLLYEGRGTALVGTLWSINANGSQTVFINPLGNNPTQVVYTSPVGIQFGGTVAHICVTVNRATNTASFYQNGALQSAVTTTGSTGSISPINPLNYIFFDEGGVYFSGCAFNFSIYSGIALSPAQVSQNFNALRGRYGI